jgi:hypothetical protein
MPTSLIKLCDTGLESRRAFALSKIRSQNQHSLINWPLAQQVRQSNPLKLLGYLSVLIQEGLHKLA